jgi:hypothetical protein
VTINKKLTMKSFNIVILIIFSCDETLSQHESASFHDKFDSLLRQNVGENGKIDYENITRDPTQLIEYTKKLNEFSPISHPKLFPTPLHTLSYWINAYNATMIAFIVQNYPIKSILEIDSLKNIFKKNKSKFGNEILSLNDIERSKLLNKFKDPRIHFTLNCGSSSCPPLKNSSYTNLNVKDELIAREKRFITDLSQFYFKNDTLYVNKIFDWYSKDFKKWYSRDNALNTRQHIAVNYLKHYDPYLHLRSLRLNRIPVQFIEYNWILNDSILR